MYRSSYSTELIKHGGQVSPAYQTISLVDWQALPGVEATHTRRWLELCYEIAGCRTLGDPEASAGPWQAEQCSQLAGCRARFSLLLWVNLWAGLFPGVAGCTVWHALSWCQLAGGEGRSPASWLIGPGRAGGAGSWHGRLQGCSGPASGVCLLLIRARSRG